MKRIIISQSITRRNEEGLTTYLEEINRIKGLTPDEEAELSRRIKEGDEQALTQLVNANLKFVVSVAKTYQNQGLSLADLIEEGNLGLVQAARKFDESRGFKFITYAVWWIRQSILQALTEQSRMVRLPNNQNQLLRHIRRYEEDFLKENGQLPTLTDIADEMEVSEDRVREVLQANTRSRSLDAPLSGDEDCGTLLDITPDTEVDEPDADIDQDALGTELRDVFRRTLKPRDIYVLMHSFGIGCRECSQEEIGMDLGLTRERVRQIRERALQKLRNNRLARERLSDL